VFEVNVVQNLCRAIAQESDPDRTNELLDALRHVIKDQQEEFRVRLLSVARQRVANLVNESEASDRGCFDLSYYDQSRRDAAMYPSFGSRSLFVHVCLTLLHQEFKPDEL
jgi:hypothetical protein